ncbi:MAG TPA: alkaline phosphatase family protein [Gemmatimonadaceae bacterium]|nr:alkaline phosphatase family protein [Gemmatimonadaceae bacterium]
MLAVDAANPWLLERWASDGTLPNLRALMSRGLVGHTRNLDGFAVGATWPSWYTGVTPARHGLHYLVQLRPGTYELYRPADEGEALVKRPPVWSHLSRAGRRVAVLDVPVSAIDRSLNGVQTVEWGGHDSLFGIQSHPSELAGRIISAYGAHPLATPCDAIGRATEDYKAFVACLVAGVRLKTRWTADLLALGRWDFFLQVFTEAHCVGHQCWHLHDPAHPAHDAIVATEIGDPLRLVYQAIDTGIGHVLERAGDACVLVLSLHGMSHAFGAQFMLRDLLVSLGVTQPLSSGPQARGASRMRRGLRAVWRRLPRSVREQAALIKARLPWDDAAPPRLQLGIDPRQSRCFPHGNGLAAGGIRLNLAGREPEGIVAQGTAAETLEAQLTRDLLEIVDDDSRRPLVRRVLRTRDHYSGEHLNLLPDLLVEWDDVRAIGSASSGRGVGATLRAVSPKIRHVVGTNHYGRTGEHRPEGLFVAAGPRAHAGRMFRSVSILDFAPTLANVFGVALPESDGTAIPELLDAWR